MDGGCASNEEVSQEEMDAKQKEEQRQRDNDDRRKSELPGKLEREACVRRAAFHKDAAERISKVNIFMQQNLASINIDLCTYPVILFSFQDVLTSHIEAFQLKILIFIVFSSITFSFQFYRNWD